MSTEKVITSEVLKIIGLLEGVLGHNGRMASTEEAMSQYGALYVTIKFLGDAILSSGIQVSTLEQFHVWLNDWISKADKLATPRIKA